MFVMLFNLHDRTESLGKRLVPMLNSRFNIRLVFLREIGRLPVFSSWLSCDSSDFKLWFSSLSAATLDRNCDTWF